MAYYTALTTAWTNASQASGATLPANVVGSLLNGLSTAQKLTAINAWTLPVPQKAILAPSSILNAIVFADLASLTQLQVTQLTLLLAGSNVDASSGTSIRLGVQALFSGKATTLANLTALVAPYDNATLPWWQATLAQGGGALNSPVGVGDLAATGLS